MKVAFAKKTLEDSLSEISIENFLAAGADRLGTSSAIKLIKGENTSGY